MLRAHAMYMPGHRNIKNTLICTQLVDFEDEDDFHSATARTLKEAKELVKAGFSYVCDIEDVKLFKNRKWPHAKLMLCRKNLC